MLPEKGWVEPIQGNWEDIFTEVRCMVKIFIRHKYVVKYQW